MTPALAALFPVSGAPLPGEDIAAFGGDGVDWVKGDIWVGRLPDDIPTDRSDDATGTSLFAGWIDRQAASEQRERPAAHLTTDFAKTGDAACRSVPGEWLWMRWEAQSNSVTLAASENRLQPIYYASNGACVAVSSSLRRIAQLSWLSGRFDSVGLLRSMGRTNLRETLGDASILEGVSVLLPGTVVRLGPGKARSVRSAPSRASLPKWQGSFMDAVVETRGLLEDIANTYVARHKRLGVFLSGGLDSSTVAWMLASQANDPSDHVALSSAAPKASGLADETERAEGLAQNLGLSFQRVVPALDASPYRPADRMFAFAEAPMVSQRHYLYSALFQAAADTGLTAVLDGALGELSVTSSPPLPWHVAPLRAARRAAISALRRPQSEGAQGLFHVRLAEHRLETLAYWGAETGAHIPTAAWNKATLQRADTPIPGLWHGFPFRDKRLLELVATMPLEFLTTPDTTRRLGRVVLEGRVPDAVRLTPTKLPFSPDYVSRLRSHSAAAVDRIQTFRAIGADDWLDLDWLHGALLRIGRGEALSPKDQLQAQATSIAAEFLVWWAQPNGS